MREMVSSEAPIGIFDSGLGGLTVVREIARLLPSENQLFIADQDHVPYGGRPLDEVCAFACGISDSLFEAGCKAVVMACNISTATGLEHVKRKYPDRIVLGVIQPGAHEAIHRSINGRIGLLATQGTVASGAYGRALAELNAGPLAAQSACPRFVPLVEAGNVAGSEPLEAAREYLKPILQTGADTVILGCTHYPFLLKTLHQAAPEIMFIDPALETVRTLQELLAEKKLGAPSGRSGRCCLRTTGDRVRFAEQIRTMCPELASPSGYEPAYWQQDKLLIPERSALLTR